MTLRALLTVGRISNLPTIWTNVLAAAVLAQSSVPIETVFNAGDMSVITLWLLTLCSLSMMYLGGMYLNDAFDSEWDKQNNPTRPIAAGMLSKHCVWVIGVVLLLLAVVMIGCLYQSLSVLEVHVQGVRVYYGWFAAGLLVLAIIAYNAWHKRYVHSALIMGACRSGVYFIGALLLGQLTMPVTLASLSLFLYVAGLTYFAQNEHVNKISSRWPLLLLFSPVLIAAKPGVESLYFWLYLVCFFSWIVRQLGALLTVRASIGGLLAAIPLLDGLMLASVNALIPSLVCLLVFLITPRLHRWVSGT